MNKRASFIANEQGFTLTEIIAVLVVLGILAAVAVPKYMNLQVDARNRAAQGAIAEVKSRLSIGYGQFVLRNASEPANVAAICTAVGDTNILPAELPGTVPVGNDFTVSIAALNTTDATISVTVVQGITLDSAVNGTWIMP